MRRILGVHVCSVLTRRIIRPMRGLPLIAVIAVIADFRDFPVARSVTARSITLHRSTGIEA